ncbi:MAG: hypothetical protein ACK58T_29295 [Phycisphaerae bacterium]|jgi:hypothetical protein
MHKLLAGAGGAAAGAGLFWWVDGVRFDLPPQWGISAVWSELAVVGAGLAVRAKAKSDSGKVFGETLAALPAALFLMRFLR